MQQMMSQTKAELESALPFAMEPVVYDFAINEHGTRAVLLDGNGDAGATGRSLPLMPPGYYAMVVPDLVRLDRRQLSMSRRAELGLFASAARTTPALAGTVYTVFDRLLPSSARSDADDSARTLDAMLADHGFDPVQHEQIRADLRAGRLGLAQNRLPANSDIRDVVSGDVFDASEGLESLAPYRGAGLEALRSGAVAVVSLAGGVGTRWTQGAGVVKALHPFCRLGGQHRSFIEVHLAKSRRISRLAGISLPHVITTSYLTHDPIAAYLARENNYRYGGPVYLSPGRAIGLRLVPMARDLRFAWEEMPQQLLDEQEQKVRESLHAALVAWARERGEGSDYTDNLPQQCLHPVGHWYEVPNMLKNGVLAQLLRAQSGLQYLMVHNIDALGTDVDPAVLGWVMHGGGAFTAEVITRSIEDRGGGLARVGGRLRLLEGLAMPREEDEFGLSYYNSNTSWLHIDLVLGVFGLTREIVLAAAAGDAAARESVTAGIRNVATRHADLHHVEGRQEALGARTRGHLPRGAVRKALGRHDGFAGTAVSLSRGAADAGPKPEGSGATRRLAARRISELRRGALRMGMTEKENILN